MSNLKGLELVGVAGYDAEVGDLVYSGCFSKLWPYDKLDVAFDEAELIITKGATKDSSARFAFINDALDCSKRVYLTQRAFTVSARN